MGGRKWWVMGFGLCALLLVDTGVARAQVSISQSNQKKTLDCAGKDATITGSLNELTLTGDCPALTIKGSDNVIAVEAVGTVRVVGTNNKVTFQRSTIDRGPKITKSGLGNVVSKAELSAAVAAAAPGGGSGDKAPASARASSAGKAAASSAKAGSGKSSGGAEASAGAAGEPLVVSDEKATRSIDCRGRGISVMGNGNTLTLRGTCGKVDVTGNDNIISVDTVQAIATTGNHNRVTWTHAAEGEAPSTSDLGNGNAIRRASPQTP